jgi:hypothetical protein
MTAACDYLGQLRGTRWIGLAPVSLGPGATDANPRRVQANTACLIVALVVQGYAGVWTSAFLRFAARIKGSDLLMKDQIPVASSILWDEAGLRTLPDPIPLQSDEYLEVWVTNDDAAARSTVVQAEVVELTPDQLARFKGDPEYRASVLDAVRASRRR